MVVFQKTRSIFTVSKYFALLGGQETPEIQSWLQITLNRRVVDEADLI